MRIAPALLLLSACSSSNGAGHEPADAGASASHAATGSSDATATGAAACGSGPVVKVGGTLTSYLDATVFIAGARLTGDVCPDLVATTDSRGYAELGVPKGVPFTGKFEHPDYIPMRTTVERFEGDFDASGYMFPTSLSSTLPHFGATVPTVLVVVVLAVDELPADAPDACRSKEGVSYGVVDHPEAVVTYFSGTAAPTPDPTLTATGALGIAEISGVAETAPGESLQLTVKHPGCPLTTLTSYPHLDRITLENGVLTAVPVRIPATPWPPSTGG
jgi:hypothetical protein